MARCRECRQNLTSDNIGHAHTCSLRPQRRSERHRRTPSEAEGERLQQRMQEAAARSRRQAHNQQIAAQAQAALLSLPPVTSGARSELDNVAFNIHNAYDWGGRGDQCVTAVVRENTGRYVVFSQRHMDVMAQYGREHYAAYNLTHMPGGGDHLHAEMYAVLHYLLQQRHPGHMIASIGVSKPICPLCKAVLDYLGIEYNENWITKELSSHWKDPWDMLSASCKPPIDSWRKKDGDPDDGGIGGGGGGSLSIAVA